MSSDLTRDHLELEDTLAARRYFGKFERITRHMRDVAAAMTRDKRLTEADAAVLGHYATRLATTFRALSYKYLMTGRVSEVASRALTIDRVESGFPVYAELLQMANDAQQAEARLSGMPAAADLKAEMIRQILSELIVPTRLQYAMSLRLYYEALAEGGLFWAQNDPQAIWTGNVEPGNRRKYTLHWAHYETQYNIPVIYLMDVEDSGRTALIRDERRWPEVQSHLIAQAIDALKLVTIARGFDQSFDTLHPKRLRRIRLGPMYSHSFTAQAGPIRQVLADAKSEPGEDWTLAWTLETLVSERVEQERAGWFSTVEREIYTLDPFAPPGVEPGATRTDRALILPERPYQVLAELNPPGFSGVRKFVVGKGDRVLSYA